MTVHDSPVILAIDAGTTGITALVVNRNAEVIASGYREFTQHFPADGRVEHDLGEIWSATVAAAEQAMAQIDRSAVAAVGITNQRETWCLWDRETLGAARRAIVWQDRRTAGLCQSLREAGHEPLVVEKTGLRLDPYFSATKAMWVRSHEPHLWAQVEEGRIAMGTIDSFLVARMTRGLEHITDATNASRTLLYDIHNGAWSPELCDIFGIPMEALPTVVPSYGRLAMTDPSVFCGLEVPITGIAGDQQAALAGQAGFGIGAAKCTYGTGSFLFVHTGETLSPAGRVCSPRSPCSTLTVGWNTRSRERSSSPDPRFSGYAMGWGSSITRPKSKRSRAAFPIPPAWCSSRR
jgi:glycerol kinase